MKSPRRCVRVWFHLEIYDISSNSQSEVQWKTRWVCRIWDVFLGFWTRLRACAYCKTFLITLNTLNATCTIYLKRLFQSTSCAYIIRLYNTYCLSQKIQLRSSALVVHYKIIAVKTQLIITVTDALLWRVATHWPPLWKYRIPSWLFLLWAICFWRDWISFCHEWFSVPVSYLLLALTVKRMPRTYM